MSIRLFQMPIVTARYWNMVHGMTPEQVAEDKEGMQVMRELARNMAYMLRCLEAGKKAGIALPRAEEFRQALFRACGATLCRCEITEAPDRRTAAEEMARRLSRRR